MSVCVCVCVRRVFSSATVGDEQLEAGTCIGGCGLGIGGERLVGGGQVKWVVVKPENEIHILYH